MIILVAIAVVDIAGGRSLVSAAEADARSALRDRSRRRQDSPRPLNPASGC